MGIKLEVLPHINYCATIKSYIKNVENINPTFESNFYIIHLFVLLCFFSFTQKVGIQRCKI